MANTNNRRLMLELSTTCQPLSLGLETSLRASLRRRGEEEFYNVLRSDVGFPFVCHDYH